MTTAAKTVTRNAPETDSRKTQVTVSRAIHVLSTEDEPRQIVSHRDRTCRNLETLNLPAFSSKPSATSSGGCGWFRVRSQGNLAEVGWSGRNLTGEAFDDAKRSAGGH